MNAPFENAQWIWSGDRRAENVFVDFVFDFEAKEGDEALLHLSCDFQYALFLNGRFFNYGQYADLESYKVYDSLPLTGLNTGKNTVKISAWHEERETSCSVVQEAGVIYALYLNGKEAAVSGPHTLAARDKRYQSENVSSNQIVKNAVYDEVHAPAQVFAPAQEVEKTEVLFPRPIQKQEILPAKDVRVVSKGSFLSTVPEDVHDQGKKAYEAYFRLDPPGKKPIRLPDETGIELSEEGDGSWIIADLGEETVGLFTMELVLPEDCRVTVGWGEHLDDGRVRSYLGGRNFCLDLFLKKGENRFLYPFRRLGARYLQLGIYCKKAVVKHLSLLPTEYPLSHEHDFSCSDRLHNRIFAVARRTLELCMHEHYEDCPWREQALYPMDSRNQMLCGYYAFGEFAFPKASLELLNKVQRPDGLLQLTAPSRGPLAIPSFSAVYFVQLCEYMRYSGDVDFAYRMADSAEGILKSFEKQMANNGLARLYTDDKTTWNFYEWQKGLHSNIGNQTTLGKVIFESPLNAFISAAYTHAAEIFSAAGDSRAAQCKKRAEELNEAIHRRFFDAENHRYFTCFTETDGLTGLHQLTQALCVFCGACPEEELEAVLSHIWEDKELLPATLSHSIFVYDALMKRPELYARKVMEDIADKWGDMLYHNATSFWETSLGADDFQFAGSLCHGWSAVPIYFYFRYALGYRRETKSFAPVDCGLYEIKGNVDRLL